MSRVTKNFKRSHKNYQVRRGDMLIETQQVCNCKNQTVDHYLNGECAYFDQVAFAQA